ncbi:MAG: hypothetical protein HGA53_03335 [Anaerolineaceae bacterium]|nr:hypothetical protein [Anaerolineaceae bacterium]
MKSAQLFWDQIASYHDSTIIIQLFMIAAGILLTVLLFTKPSRLYNNLMKIYLGCSFAFQSIVFFWGFDQSPIGRFFAGPLFLVIAGLFLADIFFGKIEFTFPKTKWARVVLFVGLGLVIIGYPLISYLLGHRYPRLTTPFMPCPLTVFALILLTASLPRIDQKVYCLLLVWAAMGLPKVFGLFDVREDSILFAAGLYALVILIKNWQQVRLTTGSTAKKMG